MKTWTRFFKTFHSFEDWYVSIIDKISISRRMRHILYSIFFRLFKLPWLEKRDKEYEELVRWKKDPKNKAAAKLLGLNPNNFSLKDFKQRFIKLNNESEELEKELKALRQTLKDQGIEVNTSDKVVVKKNKND